MSHTLGVAPTVLEDWQSSWVQGIIQQLTEVPPEAESGVSVKPACPRMEETGILTQLVETEMLPSLQCQQMVFLKVRDRINLQVLLSEILNGLCAC